MWDIHDPARSMYMGISLAERYAAQVARSRLAAVRRRRKRLNRLAGVLLTVSAVCVILLLLA